MTFKIEINKEELRKRKLFVATPCYGGQCFASYTQSMMGLAELFFREGIELRTFFLSNESLIPRGRAMCADEFMRSDCTHMLFIDSDIGFNPHDVLGMLAMMGDDTDYDIVCAPYPKKNISWEKIKAAVNKGFADDNPEVLSEFVGDFVFNPKHIPGKTEFSIHEPLQISEGGTGYMMIKRSTFELFDKHFPEYRYTPDHVRTEHFDGSRQITLYFQAEIDPVSNRYLSEDYFFCRKIEEVGGKVWLLPWVRTTHTGTYVFGGSLQALAAAQVSPTADMNELKKNKKK